MLQVIFHGKLEARPVARPKEPLILFRLAEVVDWANGVNDMLSDREHSINTNTNRN